MKCESFYGPGIRRTGFAALLLAVGCSGDDPAGPTTAAGEATPPPLRIATAIDVTAARSALEDATTRLLPALRERDGALALRRALERLNAALGASDWRSASAGLEDVAAALAVMEAAIDARSPERPELAAIGLALQAARLSRPHATLPTR